MDKIERQIYYEIRYEHKPELIPPIKATDPMIVEDHGNDLSMCCGLKCYEKYIFG
jgi:hypothetical protein